jgi:hypothetical protein
MECRYEVRFVEEGQDGVYHQTDDLREARAYCRYATENDGADEAWIWDHTTRCRYDVDDGPAD